MTYDPRRRSTLTRINSIQADRVQEFHTKIRKLNYYAKWTFDSLLHTPRIVGNERISRQRIVKNFLKPLNLPLDRRCRIISRPSQSSTCKLRESDFLHQPTIELKT